MTKARIGYMGSKWKVSERILTAINTFKPDICLDLFAGMCSISSRLHEVNTNAWCNDVQSYAKVVSDTIICSQKGPPDIRKIKRRIIDPYTRNKKYLFDRYNRELKEEEKALKSVNHTRYKEVVEHWNHAGNSRQVVRRANKISERDEAFPYELFTLYYSHGYIGLRQSIEIDSIKYGIDKIKDEVGSDCQKWLLLSLMQTLTRLSTSPGHFAQYLNVKEGNFQRIKKQRLKSAYDIFMTMSSELEACGHDVWRKNNRSFKSTATRLIEKLNSKNERPDVVYADPPYSKAQYSRYYHLLETLIKYDYPHIEYKGRYRDDRYINPYSKKGEVKSAFEKLIRLVSVLGSDLVLSYPTNGMLQKVSVKPTDILCDYFDVCKIVDINLTHSTLGGSTGAESNSVQEKVYVCQSG